MTGPWDPGPVPGSALLAQPRAVPAAVLPQAASGVTRSPVAAVTRWVGATLPVPYSAGESRALSLCHRHSRRVRATGCPPWLPVRSVRGAQCGPHALRCSSALSEGGAAPADSVGAVRGSQQAEKHRQPGGAPLPPPPPRRRGLEQGAGSALSSTDALGRGEGIRVGIARCSENVRPRATAEFKPFTGKIKSTCCWHVLGVCS